MKEIKLKKLVLNGYRGQHRTIDFGENVTTIYGRNGLGKSTVLDSLCQLLTRADSRNRTDFEMFDTKHNYTNEDNPIAEITGVFVVDGYETTIKQSAQIKFKRNKETDTYERGSGITYSLVIDDIERSATSYKEWIEQNIAPIEKIKTVFNIYHFLQNITEWKTQRAMLAEISGEITQYDFKGDFSDLFAEMEHYTIEELKQRAANQIKPLRAKVGEGNKMGELQISINAITDNLPDISEVDKAIANKERIDAEIEQLQNERKGLSEPLLKAIYARQEAQKLVGAAEDEYNKAEREYDSVINSSLSVLQAKLNDVTRTNHDIELRNEEKQRRQGNLKASIERRRKLLSAVTTELETLRTQRDENKALEFTSTECAYCHQELPSELQEKAREQFNAQKDVTHQRIVAQGKAKAQEKVKLESEIETLMNEANEELVLESLLFKADIEKEIEDYKANIVAFEDTDEGKELLAKISDAKAKIPVLPIIDTTEIDNKLSELDSERTECINTISIKGEYDRQKATIKAKTIELRESAQHLATLEYTLRNIKDYEREYADLVRIKTNDLFNRVSIEMLKENKSGEMVDTCDILYRDVPSRVFNNAEKTLSGLDIAMTFGKHYGVKLPLILDNQESVNDDALPNLEDYQVVKLVVSDSDYDLRVEQK